MVLQFVTNAVQSLPANYPYQVLSIWLRFNCRNRILTPLIPPAALSTSTSPLVNSPLPLHPICNNEPGGISEYRISNVDQTPLPWQYLIGSTYDIQGTKTGWSKSAQSGSEKHQCTLFLSIFPDRVPRVPQFSSLLLSVEQEFEKGNYINGIREYMLSFRQQDG